MITRADLEKTNLQPIPYGQMLVVNFPLRWDYHRGSLPFSSGGRIVYRVGEPLTLEDRLTPFAIDQPFTPGTFAGFSLLEI